MSIIGHKLDEFSYRTFIYSISFIIYKNLIIILYFKYCYRKIKKSEKKMVGNKEIKEIIDSYSSIIDMAEEQEVIHLIADLEQLFREVD